jgi:hypothetical protein
MENNETLTQEQSKEIYDFDVVGYIKHKPQEQSILSIEDRASNYALKEWGLKEIPIEETVSRDRFDNSKDDFIAGANEMLPIIKELLEALIKTCPNVYDYKDLINKAKNING